MGNCMGVCYDDDKRRKSVHEIEVKDAVRRNEEMGGFRRTSLKLLPVEEMANACIVIDQGAGNVRAGFAGETLPRVQFPNIHASIEEGEKKGIHVGEDVYKVRDYERIFMRDLDIVHGEQQIWEQMETVYKHTC